MAGWFTFIELPKFKKELHELFSILDKWIYFIKNAKNLTLIPSEYESIKEFKEAFEIATQYTWDKKEMEIYDYVDLRLPFIIPFLKKQIIYKCLFYGILIENQNYNN